MADAKTKWHEASRDLLAKIDIRSIYESFGVKFPPNARERITGWTPCHAFGRDDNNPSAEVNTGYGATRGRYRDFAGDGTACSLFDFAAKYVSGYGPTWREARRKFADDLKFELPKGEEGLVADRLDLFEPSISILYGYAQKKPPIKAAAIKKCGALASRYPRTAPEHKKQIILAFPYYGESLLDLDPTGYGCVGEAGNKILKYMGKGNEPKSEKSLTFGTYGLMNVHALRHLATAKVVWIAEGIPDMLAIQSVIPEWLDTEHVVITTGGCSYHPRPEWIQYFAGKKVYIVPDADTPGQVSGKVWAGAVVGVAAETRIVKLPYDIEENHGKDARDFLNDRIEKEEDPFKALLALAAEAIPISIDDESQKLKPHEALLQKLQVVVTGQIEGTDEIEIYSESLAKKSRIKKASNFKYVDAVLAIGGDIVQRFILRPGAEPEPGKNSMLDLCEAIAHVGGQKFLSRKPALGAGIWRIGERIVLVGHKSCDIWNGKSLESVSSPAVDGQQIEFANEPWYDRDHLANLLQLAGEQSWCEKVADEATEIFSRWNNWKHKNNPSLITGLVLGTWVQTLWPWRPHVGVLGQTKTGKTKLINDCLKHLFGKLEAFNTQSTEAGIRQAIDKTAAVLMIDEFEEDKNRPHILKLLRTASRAGRQFRGSSHGKATSYSLQHICWVASTEIGLHDAPDMNRFIMLDLENRPLDAPNQLEVPPVAKLQVLGQKLLAVAIRNADRALEIGAELIKHDFKADGRHVENFAVPGSMLAAAYGMNFDEAVALMQPWLFERDLAEDNESEEEQLLRAIYEANVIRPGGNRETVSSMIWTILHGTTLAWSETRIAEERHVNEEQLGSLGVCVKYGDEGMFFNPTALCSTVLKGTKFEHKKIIQILKRISGAEVGRRRFNSHKLRGVSIPKESIDKLLGSSDSDADSSQNGESY